MWQKVIPGMTLVSTGSRDAKLLMDYYWDTVEQCVPPEQILAAMREAGFQNVPLPGGGARARSASTPGRSPSPPADRPSR